MRSNRFLPVLMARCAKEKGSDMQPGQDRSSKIDELFRELDLDTAEKRKRFRSLADLKQVGSVVAMPDRTFQELNNNNTTGNHHA